MENYNIIIEEGKFKYGYIRGRVDNFYWYALVHRNEIDYGIDPNNLACGHGRVSRLCLYKEVMDQNENPYTGTSSIRRYIYANYKREWDVLNGSYIELVKQLVGYLDRRYSLKLVK